MSISHLSLNLSSIANVDNKLGQMAAKVALQNFDYRHATLLFFSSDLHYGVELFLQVFYYNILICRETFSSKFVTLTRQYVIFGYSVIEIEDLLTTLKILKMENSGKFIFICQSQQSHDCDENVVTELFWEYRIVNVVFIKPHGDEAAGYTYFPVVDGICNNLTPIKLDSGNNQFRTTSLGRIFGMKFRKLSFCPLHVSTFIQMPYMDMNKNGVDGDLLRIIAQGFNTSAQMRFPRRGSGWGNRQKNGTWMGSLADLEDDLANISMTSPALTLTRFSDFQISRTYYNVHVVWITHPAALENEASKLLRPFGKKTRIALITSFGLVIIAAFIVKSDKWSLVFRTNADHSPSSSVVFYSWMLFTGQAVINLPTKPTLLYIVYLWIYYCFFIRTAYQVYLISALKGKLYEDQFDSIEDAIKVKYPFGGGSALKDYYIGHAEVYDNWVNVEAVDIVPTLLNISKGKKFVLAMNWDTAKMVVKQQRISIHVLPQKIIVSPTGIFFKKYSPLADSMNLVLSRLITAGFPEKFHKDYTSYKPVQDSNDQEPLKVVHFTACFAIMIIGAIVSTVFFILEIYFGKFYKHPMSAA